ncbi:uncharacterized protein METZ01_LOCUS42023 [marine metagenome]|uniref:FlgD/Vpr Ig-like domain-containing protein n=1 Tax=marine metagenome TaxID=408172 RepID=A0A381RE51_9ZZZZ
MRFLIGLILLPLFLVRAQPEPQTFFIGGQERQYYLYLPDGISDDAPLVFVLHGYSGDALGIMNYSGMNQVADDNGFAVCYPQGLSDDWDYNFWNVGYDWHEYETVDDVEFLTELAEHLRGAYDLSRDHVFSTGMSNGGDMSYLLACEASEIFRAIAPVAGCMMTWIYDSCDPIDPIPVFEIHGTDDDVTWWEGADEIFNDGWGPWESVDTTFNFWTQLNGCTDFTMDTLPDINTSDGSYVISHKNTNGVNNNEVWLYEVVNGGHDWPGAYGNMDINSSEEIWSFFSMVIDNAVSVYQEDNDQIPNEYELEQNYPNPFNPVTTLIYSLTEENMVKITVYDMLGRKVRTLVNAAREAGRWSVRWDATNDQGGPVSDGVYLYQIRTDKFSETKKMIFIK